MFTRDFGFKVIVFFVIFSLGAFAQKTVAAMLESSKLGLSDLMIFLPIFIAVCIGFGLLCTKKSKEK